MLVQWQKWLQVHANTSGNTWCMSREQTPADFYLSYSKVPSSHDSPTVKNSEDSCALS